MASLVCPQCEHVCQTSHRFCPVCGFPVAEVARKSADPLVGTTLPGGYVILELVSVGGMGRVYRAEQKALGRTVAVKIIHPHLLGDENASVRFITEARATSRLNHPNSVSVIDFGNANGQLYLVMEFLRGRDLARITLEEGFLPFRRVIDIMRQVLAALAEAHHIGIIHRDLKPENIVIEQLRSGRDFVKVVDFGLAKMKQVEASDASNITSPGIVCGTPDFMAPEQARGDAIDGRSDIYACGVILYQLIAGRLPFEAESPTQVVLMHLSVPPADPRRIAPHRHIPDDLVDVTMHALEKDADKRYQDADELSEALREVESNLEAPGSVRMSPRDAAALARCPTCGAVVPPIQKFCGDCGTRINRVPSERAPAARRNDDAPRLPLPLAAREGDLAWFSDRRDEVSGALLGARFVGEHGVGKSRLLQTIERDALEDGDLVVATGPDPFWMEVAHFSVRRAIAQLAGLPSDGGGNSEWAAASSEARRGLAEIFGDRSRPSDSQRLGARSIRAGLNPDERRFMVAEALRWAMTRAHERARERRALLLIDDLHAIDGVSRNAFADVLAEPPLVPILVLASHTPNFDSGWEGPSRLLRGLSAELATSLSGGLHLPAGSTDERTGEVLPLYLDQVVRLAQDAGGEPPPRLADLLAQRVERLSHGARRVLQAFAVAGDVTSRPMLRRLQEGIDDLDDCLEELLARGMIVQRDLSLVERAALFSIGIAPTEEMFGTTHPLLREVVLMSIPAAVRRELHARACSAENGEPAILPIEVRAMHAYHAEDAFEAPMLLELVANRAASRADHAGSVLALRRGLDLARREMSRGGIDDPVRAVVIFNRKLGDALAHAGALTDADGVLREALDLAGPRGADRALVLASLAKVSRLRGRATEAQTYVREAKNLAQSEGRADVLSLLEDAHEAWQDR